MKPRLPEALEPIVADAKRRGSPLYVVGGFVRDALLGARTKDIDLVTEGDPTPLARALERHLGVRVETFDRFGTLRVLGYKGYRIDFAQARSETYQKPAALPTVKRPSTLVDDLARRDFTVNAMALRLGARGDEELIDPHGGRRDLAAKAVRVLHARSFRDDPTRLYRAARYSCRLGFDLDPATESLRIAAVSESVMGLLSRERLRGELLRVLDEKEPVCALARLRDWGLAAALHRGLSWPKDLADGSTALERLGMIVVDMGREAGGELVESLHLERSVSHALHKALEASADKASPRVPLPPLARRVLGLSVPGLPRAALSPLLVDGNDLKANGIGEGPRFRTELERAARAQWKGEFATRAQGLRWLKKSLGL